MTLVQTCFVASVSCTQRRFINSYMFYNLTGDTAQVGGGHEPQNEGRVDGVTLRLQDIAAGLRQ